ESAKSGEPRKWDKPIYQVVNWSAYNQSLRKRGMVTLYFPKGDLASQFYNPHSYVEGASGRVADRPQSGAGRPRDRAGHPAALRRSRSRNAG
ncbi:hypothetical protein, partial [Chromobacterium amazonense]|uniref:hypothetical protein n=1 Tax=Chromobacterium amazonense TaxID=1382803 RepID=UPI003F79E636